MLTQILIYIISSGIGLFLMVIGYEYLRKSIDDKQPECDVYLLPLFAVFTVGLLKWKLHKLPYLMLFSGLIIILASFIIV